MRTVAVWGGFAGMTSATRRSWLSFSMAGLKKTTAARRRTEAEAALSEQLSQSVDREVSQVAEFVHNAVGALLAEGERGAGEVGECAGPEVALSWISKGPASLAAGDVEARDEALEACT